jgi:hypothetical protein
MPAGTPATLDWEKGGVIMRRAGYGPGCFVVIIVLSSLSVASAAPILPDFDAATFTAESSVSGNLYFPLVPGTLYTYAGQPVENGDTELNRIFVTFDTKEILGVQTRVVRDTAFVDGLLAEDTFDWFAQDTAGNVWYMGEDTTAFEYDDEGDPIGTSKEGSWQAGVDEALPGAIMLANPAVGDNYYQEFAPDVALDQATVISLDETISIGLGTFTDVLQTLETTELEPDAREFKYYAPGLGLILIEEDLDKECMNPEFVSKLVCVEVIPAPAALPLAALGLGGLVWLRRQLR